MRSHRVVQQWTHVSLQAPDNIIQLDCHLGYHQNKKQENKTVPWMISSRSERRVLQRRCQSTPTLEGVILLVSLWPVPVSFYCVGG